MSGTVQAGRPSSVADAMPTLVSVTATLAVSVIGPVAAFYAMNGSREPVVQTALGDRATVGVMDLYVQLITVYSALVALMATALVVHVTNDAKVPRYTSAVIGGAFAFWFLWLYTMGGAAGTALGPYVPTGDWRPGELRIPPLNTLLTQTRVAVALASLVLGYLSLRSSRNPPRLALS